MKAYTVPPKFYEDHRSRDLPENGTSRSLGRKGSRLEVLMDDAAYADLLSDAQYYSDGATDAGMPGLAASARATVKALREQGPPAPVWPDPKALRQYGVFS